MNKFTVTPIATELILLTIMIKNKPPHSIKRTKRLRDYSETVFMSLSGIKPSV